MDFRLIALERISAYAIVLRASVDLQSLVIRSSCWRIEVVGDWAVAHTYLTPRIRISKRYCGRDRWRLVYQGLDDGERTVTLESIVSDEWEAHYAKCAVDSPPLSERELGFYKRVVGTHIIVGTPVSKLDDG